jgi:ectoine hydroxylase-related dioxygenase (phytanoyl-CoA dioxygenase family)
VGDVPTLSDELVARFRRDGYLRLETLAEDDEVKRLREVFDGVFADGARIAPDDRVELAGRRGALAQVPNPERYAPGLVETSAYRAAAAVARALLGDGAGAMGNHAILKPARDGAETPWHQDEAYWDAGFRHRAISIWTPLQPATVANGCMWFVPGSHAGAVLAHRRSGRGQALVVDEQVAFADAVACELPAGGATVHAGRTLHYAGPNRTNEPRRALVMMFSLPGEPLPQPRHAPWLDG